MQLCVAVVVAMFLTIETVVSNDVPHPSLLGDPNYDKIIQSFPNKSESDLIDLRNKLKSLNARVINSVPQNSAPIDIPKNPTYDAEMPGTPHSIVEINKNIADYLYQSDILLTEEQLDDLVPSARKKRKATSNTLWKWPTKANGVIPYFLDASLTAQKIAVIQASIAFWEANACLKFQLNGAGANSLLFFNGAGCYSYIGMIGGQQPVSIGNGCEYLGIATHEIGHALGFYHEQSRYDRDSYVSINFANVVSGYEHNFDKATTAEMNLYNIAYDYGSVMHYAYEDFAADSNVPVIIALNPKYQQTMGQRRAPSFSDVLGMNRHYGCDALCASSTTVCQNGGYPDPANCNQCKCPASFGGTLCNTLAPAENGVCGADLTATTAWQTFSATVGTTSTTDTATTCYWHLNSPAGTNIEVKLTLTGGSCNPGCFWNSVEIKLDADYTNSGIRHCCLADYTSTPYVSSTNLVPVIVYGNYQTAFSIDYRYVSVGTTSTQSSTSTSTTTTQPIISTTTTTSTTTTQPIISTSTTTSTQTSVSTTTATLPKTCVLPTLKSTCTPTSTTTSEPSQSTTEPARECWPGGVWLALGGGCVGQCYTEDTHGGRDGTFYASFTAQPDWQSSPPFITISYYWTGCFIPINSPNGTRVQFNLEYLDGVCETGCPSTALVISDNFQTPTGPYCCSNDAPKLFTMTSNKALLIVRTADIMYSFNFTYRYITDQPTTLTPPVTSTTTTLTPPVTDTTTTLIPQNCPTGTVWYPLTGYCISQCYTTDQAWGNSTFYAKYTALSTWRSSECITIPLQWWSGCYVPIESPEGTQVQINIASVTPGVCEPGCPITALSVSDNSQALSGPYCCSGDAPQLLTMTSNRALLIVKSTTAQFSFDFSYRYLAPPTTPPVAVQKCSPGDVWYPLTGYCIPQCYATDQDWGEYTFYVKYNALSTWKRSECVTVPLQWRAGCYVVVQSPPGTQVQINIENLIPGVCEAGCPVSSLAVNDNFQTLNGPYCCSEDAPKLLTMTSNNALVIVQSLTSMYTFDFTYRYINESAAITTTTMPTTTKSTVTPSTKVTTITTNTVTTKATTKATTKPTTKATTKPTTKATTKPTTKATTKATTKPTTKATTKPTTKATTKATTKPTTKATTKATTKPTTKATTKPTTKATTKATTKPTTKKTTTKATTKKAG